MSLHGMSTGGVGKSGCRPPTRAGHPLGCPESPLRAKIKSGNQKKSTSPTPPRTCTSRGGMCTRSDFSCAILASAGPRPKPRPNGMWGRPFAALRAKSPFLGASAADFSPARFAKPRPRRPPFVRTQPPLRALWRRKDGKEPPPAHQPRTKSCFQPKWRREKMRFSDQASSCCSGELWSPPTPGADMLPTTSSDPEGFRSRPIAFWKALEPLSKAYISTSTLHCDLRI